MLRKLLTPLLMLLSLQIGHAQEVYDKIRVWSDDTPETISQLLQAGIDPEGLEVRQGVYVDAIVSQREKEAVHDSGLLSEDLIQDLSTFYASRLSQGVSRELGYGSMGGYLTFDEIVNSMDSLHAAYPELVAAKESIGTSFEGREIWAFRISDNPTLSEGEPEVLYTSLIHAREPAAMMTLMHFAWSLAEQYAIDPRMTYLVDEREMWFIPVINPDGYVFNQLTNPNGGGMHRKNRQPGCTSLPGIDLNRNWGFQWGFNDVGSSPDPCSNTYRGSDPFSEPETQAVRDFVLSHDFQTAFNYHSYGNLLIKPFGYDESVELPAPDNAIYGQMGPDLVADNNYLFGTGLETVGYTVNGDAVDYMYGELGMINFTPEVGAGFEGAFWPPTELIFELAEENISMNVHLAGCAGSWIDLKHFELISESIMDEGDIVTSELIVMNKGLGMETTDAVLYLYSPDSSLIPSVDSLNVSGLSPQAFEDFGSNELSFEVNAPASEFMTLIISIEMAGHETQVDTFTWLVGAPDTLFIDDFQSGMDAWSSSVWGLEADATGNQYLSDSPLGSYAASAFTTVELNQPIDLTGITAPTLTFDAAWDIETGWDFCQVLGSADGGQSWIALSGQHTVTGNGASAQPLGEPGYHGSQDWVSESIFLSQFVDSPEFLLSFRLLTDMYIEGDGFKVDNIAVLGFGPPIGLGDVNQDGTLNISDAVLLLESIISGTALDASLVEIADTNQDTIIDILDLVLLVEMILES